MFSIKPLRVLPPPQQILASDNDKIGIQDSLVNSLKQRGKQRVGRFFKLKQLLITEMLLKCQINHLKGQPTVRAGRAGALANCIVGTCKV